MAATSPAPGLDLGPIYAAAGTAWNVDPTLLQAVAHVESGGNVATPNSSAGAQGLMQIMPQTAASLGVTDPRDPQQAIYGAAKLLSQNLDRYGNVPDALRAYNAGTNQANWNNPETAAYVPKVAAAYSLLHAAGANTGPAPGSYQVAGNAGVASDVAPVDAPPAGQSGSRNPYAGMSTSDFFAQTAGAPIAANTNTPGAAASPAPAATPLSSPSPANPYAGMSSNDFFAATAGAAPGPTGTAPNAPDPASQGFLPTVGAAIGRSVHDITDRPAELLASGANAIGLTGLLNRPRHRGADRSTDRSRRRGRLAELRRQLWRQPAGDGGAYRWRHCRDVAHPGLWRGPAGRCGRCGGFSGAGAVSPALGGLVEGGNALLSGTAGAGGSGAANMLLRGGSAVANGALQGGAAGALTAGSSNAPLGQQVALGAGGGAVLGPAGNLLLGGLRGATGIAGNAIAPFTEGGRNAIADSVIRKFAADGPITVNADPLVPGSAPTLAQATANPGLATLERAVKDVRPNPFTAQAATNSAARSALLSPLQGDPAALQDLIDNRSQNATTAYNAAFGGATSPVSPQPVLDTIDSILKGPSGQRDAVQSALNNIRDKLIVTPADPATNTPAVLQTDPAQLYGIRQQVTDLLSPLAQGSTSSARLAASELGQVKDALDSTIEQGAPGYGNALSTYSADSAPIDAMRYLQGKNFLDASGNPTLAKTNQALQQIRAQQALPGPRAAKNIPQGTIDQLQALQTDLLRANNSLLGKSVGSNTFQNLATNNLLGRISPAMALLELPHNPLLAVATGAGRALYNSKNDAILDALSGKLLDPTAGAAAFTPSPPGFVNRLLQVPLGSYTAPTSGVAGNMLLGARQPAR